MGSNDGGSQIRHHGARPRPGPGGPRPRSGPAPRPFGPRLGPGGEKDTSVSQMNIL